MSEVEVDALETLEPSVKNYEEVIGGTTFVQKPLSFFGKIELFSVLAEAIEKALAEGISLGELIDELPENTANLNAKEVSETDVLVKGLMKVIVVAPELLVDIYSISLGVKKADRDEFKVVLEDIDDEQGVRILNQFIAQNWDAVMDFFSKQMPQVLETISGKLQSGSTSSKPSKPSRRRTAKQ